MACTCRKVTLPGPRPIRGIVYCSECVESGRTFVSEMKRLMVESLKTDRDQINTALVRIQEKLARKENVN